MIEEQLSKLVEAQTLTNQLLSSLLKRQGTTELKVEKSSEPVVKKENKTEKVKEEVEKPISKEDCRAALVEVAKKLGKAKATELLGRFKAEKMGDVKDSDYPAFLNATKLSLEEA